LKKNSLLKKIFITTFFFNVFNLIYAQQDPYFSTYLINPSIVNTSLSSVNTNNNVVLIYRNQWLNYSSTWEMGNNGNSPNTQILSLNMKSRDKVYSFGFNSREPFFRTLIEVTFCIAFGRYAIGVLLIVA